MDRHVYEGLVERLEAQAENNPASFQTRVLLISVAAYAALFLVLAALAAFIYIAFDWARSGHRASMFTIAIFGLTLVPVFLTVLRMFFMRLPVPEGRRITREEAPQLFEVLDKMRRKLKGPPIHHVLVDERFNAAVAQLPRWGFFGGHTNYLMLGLPYMLGVPASEMLATVAHEYGHLSNSHGKLGAWVYRQRRTFGALHEQVDDSRDSSWAHAFLAASLDRFMPYYYAYTFALSRQNEYIADQAATRLVGAQANASGLVRDILLGRWFDESFWQGIYSQARTAPRPAVAPYASMRTAFKAAYPEWATAERLTQAWREKSGWHDTHPALRDRVEATGQSPQLPAPVDMTAAEALLGAGMAKRLIQEFDQAWWDAEKKEWESRHRHAVRSRQRLQELSAGQMQALPLHDLQELALLKAEFESRQAAKPVLEHLLEQPGGPFPKAAYSYGRILLDEKNDRGLDYLVTAAQHDQRLMESAAQAGYDYLRERSGEARARDWWEKLVPQEVEHA
ncbi:M48 family metallopeptidase [Noviherbaspirillum aerium]|uniref:M48 family metallopeptidase n=1 Tax=Noviherbaspirillum aerium TaxID=2588497 RepID=UPI00124E7D04|nr:M48 family metallopeptidase [Noviherbaspirillum aerium]